MTHPVIAETTATLARLRKARLRGRAEESQHLSPNVYFCWDKAKGAADITLTPASGALLTAEIAVSGAPGWFTLNIGLGAGAFAPGGAFGLALAASSSQPITLHPFLRSALGETRHDTHLTESLRLGPDLAPRLALHRIRPQDAMAQSNGFHTLILPLPCARFRLHLQDMRAFHVPPQPGAPLPPSTLSALAR